VDVFDIGTAVRFMMTPVRRGHTAIRLQVWNTDMDFDATTIRIFLHVLGASVWVGGQIVLAGLVPMLKEIGDDAPKKAAQAFNRIAWPFFWLAVVTGVWNMAEIDIVDRSSGYQVGLLLKLLIVAASGISAYLHTTATKRSTLAIWGAIGGITALAALLFGVMLSTSL
jgi:putative copper export protein